MLRTSALQQGKGRYTDDIVLPNMTHAYFVRSPYAHARIKKVDTSAAEKADGVVAIFTGADVKESEVGGVPCGWQVDFKNGDTMKEPAHPLLCHDKVLHVGDGVAMVIAETPAQARDAAELVEVDYEVLPAIANIEAALKPGAALVHEDAPGNVVFDWQIGDKDATDAAIAAADHVSSLTFPNNRLVPNAIEPRSAIGNYDGASGKYTLYTTSQNPHLTKLLLSAFVLGLPEHKVHVISPDVGGGFGSKIFHYIEEAMVVWSAERIHRPVKWTCDRSESFLTDAHGRDHITTVDLALKSDGTFTGLRVKTKANLGAYLSTFAPAVPTYLYGTLMQGLYTTPAVHVDVTAVFTNTTAVDAYRGAGRPEATYLIERIVSTAARELGMDPAEIRLKNFIPAFDGVNEPGYQTQVALQYDSGNYAENLNKALDKVDYAGLRKNRRKPGLRDAM